MSDTVKLKRKVLITVGREYGSAGHIVARRLGERLSIPVFDKNLLTIIARKHGLDEITLLSSDERVGNLFFDSYAPYSAESGSISERLFVMQANIIKEEADKGSAIFVGRCANDILRKYDDVLSFFIFAPKEARIDYIMRADDIADASAADKIIRRMDKARRNYYQFYTDRKWGTTDGMDMLLNSAGLGIDGCVRGIENYLVLRGYADYEA